MDNYLYHITNFKSLEGILTQDTLKAGKTHHWKDLQSTGQFRNAVSLTRDLTFSSRYMPSSASVILVLDKDKLVSKYKITPVADTANELNPQSGRRVGQSKAEECIYSDITMLHNYLVKILIKNSAQVPKSTSEVLKEYTSKYNVPFTMTECLTEADHTQKAIDVFGTTYYRTRAGFMLKNGRLLDLTHDGGPREDHRNIQDAFDDVDLDSESDYLIEFMNEGNIRLIPEIPGIDIVKEPTEDQWKRLKDYISYMVGRSHYFVVQFSNEEGQQVDWKDYEGLGTTPEILLDLHDYFDDAPLNESYDYTVSDIIGTDTLYHATYKPYWEEIKKSGALRPKAHSNWDISGAFIYLSRDPDNAFSYAETSELVPEEYLDQIVVLEIDANKLNLDLLDCDHNQAYGADGYEVDYEDPQTWEEMQYAGNIPLNAIRELQNESLTEGVNNTDIWSAIKKSFALKQQSFVGPAFLLPDGSFIDVTNEFDWDGNPPEHLAVEQWLCDNNLSDNWDETEGAPTIQALGAIRMDNSYQDYIELPPVKLTYIQYERLESWLEFNSDKNKSGNVEVYTYSLASGFTSIFYKYADLFPEDIIKRIKRYYSSGVLYEAIETAENPEKKSFQAQIDEMEGDLKVTLYDAKNGHNYGAEYLEDLYHQNPSLCGKMLASIQILKILKNTTPTKYSKYLKHGIYELRASIATNEARELYFFSLGNEIFITNGFTKKSQRTPEQEIKKAERLMNEYNSFRRN